MVRYNTKTNYPIIKFVVEDKAVCYKYNSTRAANHHGEACPRKCTFRGAEGEEPVEIKWFRKYFVIATPHLKKAIHPYA